jgi:hypothetical protein
VPPMSADEGTLVGMVMPACFADWIARWVDASSFGVKRTCQSSSPVLDSERTDMREDSECIAALLNSSPSLSSKSPSSQLSKRDVVDAFEAIEAMRCAKLPGGAAIAAQQSWRYCVSCRVGVCGRRAGKLSRGWGRLVFSEEGAVSEPGL